MYSARWPRQRGQTQKARKDRHTKRKQRDREDIIRMICLSKVLRRLVYRLCKAYATYYLTQNWVNASIQMIL